MELQFRFRCLYWRIPPLLTGNRTSSDSSFARRGQEKVVQASTEGENQALADDDAIEEVVFGIGPNRLV